jgi:hypothetical protein
VQQLKEKNIRPTLKKRGVASSLLTYSEEWRRDLFVFR